MLQEKKSLDEIFNRNFVSAEGWYSQHVFKANISTKIAGRGFDDFYRHPVVLYQGLLSRCGLAGNLTGCIQEAMQLSEPVGVQSLPVMQVRISWFLMLYFVLSLCEVLKLLLIIVCNLFVFLLCDFSLCIADTRHGLLRTHTMQNVLAAHRNTLLVSHLPIVSIVKVALYDIYFM